MKYLTDLRGDGILFRVSESSDLPLQGKWVSNQEPRTKKSILHILRKNRISSNEDQIVAMQGINAQRPVQLASMSSVHMTLILTTFWSSIRDARKSKTLVRQTTTACKSKKRARKRRWKFDFESQLISERANAQHLSKSSSNLGDVFFFFLFHFYFFNSAFA